MVKVYGIWKAGALSLMPSAASYGIGEMLKVASMTFGNELLRAGAHGLAGGVFSALDGGNFGQAFLSGAAASGIGSFAQGVEMNSSLMLASTTLMGGVTAWATGGDFLQGAMQGFIIGGLNHMQHDQYDPINDRYSDKVKSRYRMRTDAKYKQKIKSEIEKDGILSFEEAYYWYGYGDGSSITVDASKMDLGRIDIRGRKVGDQLPIRTLSLYGKYNQGLVYGHIKVIYKGNNLFEILQDRYYFDIKLQLNMTVRNIETLGAWMLHGTGTPFNINFKGLYHNKR